MTFLHGVETRRMTVGPTPIQQVLTAVIGLVGIAPIHHATNPGAVSVPQLVLSDVDAPKFGPASLPGYNIPSALAAILKKAGPVVVINVFDPTVHKTTVASAARTINADKKILLPHGDLISVTVTTAADAACVAGTDYTVDRITGIITVLAGGQLAAASSAKVGYDRANPSAILASDVIGTVSGTGVRSGAQALLNAKSLVGLRPKILISPGFSATRSVADALLVIARKLRAVVLADVPLGTTRDQAIAGRVGGTGPDLGIVDERVFYTYPYLRTSAGSLEPYSQHLAGEISKTDQLFGYHWSPSNKVLDGISGLELPLTAELNDASCDVNVLNAAGLTTVFAASGEGMRTWGNRSSAFPSNPGPDTFMSILRVRDAVDEALELFSFRRIDQPINDVWIKAVLADANGLIRVLISRGAVLAGSRVTFLPELNPASELAAGRIKFTNRFMGPVPAENIVWESVLDLNLLQQAA